MDERPAEWSAWGRVSFRFVFLYFVIYALPFPLGQIPGTRSVAGWWGDLQNGVSVWVGSRLLGLEVVIQPTGSGDTAQAFAILLVELFLAAAGTLAWSLLARGNDELRLRRSGEAPLLASPVDGRLPSGPGRASAVRGSRSQPADRGADPGVPVPTGSREGGRGGWSSPV